MIKAKYTVIIYWALVVALLALYFTNDFGLVDIHKTSVVVAAGIDVEGEEVQLTALVAIPQPSQSGDNIKYVEVQGSGLTIADALNEVNSKTGFYPRLHFCKLILLGENCKEQELFKMLGCFYRRNYSELTALVAMCEGKAQDMLKMPATISPENSVAMQRALSEELKLSANVSTVTLKEIAVSNYSVSKACYLPFIQANVQGTSQNGGNGDSVGGESGNQGGNQQGGQGGESEASFGGGESSGGEGGQSGQSGGGSGQQEMEFTARKTVVFADGKYVALLDEQQSFALNLIKNKIRLAVVPCDTQDTHYTLGLKGAGGTVKFKINNGVPEMTVSFKANAQIQGARRVLDPDSVMFDDIVKPEVLDACEKEILSRFESLVEVCVENDCDLLGVRQLLHKFHYKYYDAFKDSVLKRMKVIYDIKIESLN